MSKESSFILKCPRALIPLAGKIVFKPLKQWLQDHLNCPLSYTSRKIEQKAARAPGMRRPVNLPCFSPHLTSLLGRIQTQLV